jgi:hypothetical protein
MRDDQAKRLADGIRETASLIRDVVRLQDRDALRLQGQLNELSSGLDRTEAALRDMVSRVEALQHALALDKQLADMPAELAEALAVKLDRPALDRIRAAKWEIEHGEPASLPASSEEKKSARDEEPSVVFRVMGREIPVPLARVSGVLARYVLPGSAVGAALHYVIEWLHGK